MEGEVLLCQRKIQGVVKTARKAQVSCYAWSCSLYSLASTNQNKTIG